MVILNNNIKFRAELVKSAGSVTRCQSFPTLLNPTKATLHILM
jgi:hypothetical protein